MTTMKFGIPVLVLFLTLVGTAIGQGRPGGTWSVTTIAGVAGEFGTSDGIGSAARLTQPEVVWGLGSTLYVGHTDRVRRIDLNSGAVTTDYVAPPPNMRRLREVSGMTTDGRDIYVADDQGNSILKYGSNLDYIAGQGTCNVPGCTTRDFIDGPGRMAWFNRPHEIWFQENSIYISDTENRAIRRLEMGGTLPVTTFVSSGLSNPRGIWGDGKNLYVADAGNHAIYRIDLSTRELTTIAGKPGTAGYRDGTPSEARFFAPTGLWGDGTNLYVADFNNHAIRKVEIATGETTTIAGQGTNPGSADGVGAVATFDRPNSIWGDASNLYVADWANHTIRRITPVVDGHRFTLTPEATVSVSSSDSSESTIVGSAPIHADASTDAPAGLAIFGFRQNGVLVTEAAVPASELVRSARMWAESTSNVKTGVAIANPNDRPVNITFVLTDATGQESTGTFSIPARSQLARFVDQPPFNSAMAGEGALTLDSDAAVGIVALRGLTNQRSEFIITTLPVIGLPASAPPTSLPHWADGGGWKTEVLLVNPYNEPVFGFLEFWGTGASTPAAAVALEPSGGTRFAYTVAPRSATRVRTPGTSPETQVGSVQLFPVGGSRSPNASAVFSFTQDGVIVSEAGVPPVSGSTRFRMFVENSAAGGGTGAVQTGVAMLNQSNSPAQVAIRLFDLDGTPRNEVGFVSLSAQGQRALFLNQVPGLEGVPAEFRGVAQLAMVGPGVISIVGLRGRYNERGNFLITTLPVANDVSPRMASARVFPHWVDGGGYTTQFVLYPASSGSTASGTMQLLSQAGGVVPLPLQ